MIVLVLFLSSHLVKIESQRNYDVPVIVTFFIFKLEIRMDNDHFQLSLNLLTQIRISDYEYNDF